jgi:hypothetical protein
VAVGAGAAAGGGGGVTLAVFLAHPDSINAPASAASRANVFILILFCCILFIPPHFKEALNLL